MQNTGSERRFKLLPRSVLDQELKSFILDREARGLSPRTIAWYREKLLPLRQYLYNVEGMRDVESVTTTMLRGYLLSLSEQGHNPGGVRGHFQAMRTFFRWYEMEYEPEGWQNPAAKLHPPKVPQEILEPVNLDDLQAMLSTCTRRTFTGDRDRALFLFLLDSGCRRAEVAALNIGDLDMDSGAVVVRHGKGGKFRVTFVGAKTRKAIAIYLRHRSQAEPGAPLWATQTGKRLSYDSYDGILRRRAAKAGVKQPSMHSFRRGFALACLRAGVDLVSLQRMLGHADLSVLRRYLAQTDSDLQEAHRRGGPVDHVL